MKPLSITTAWNETAAFVKREAGLLFPIALGLIALPSAFLQAVAPTPGPGEQPEAGMWMLLILPLVVLATIGQLSIITLALGREVVVRDAFAHALRRCLPAIGASLLFAAAMVVLLLPFILVAGSLANQAVTVLVLVPVILLALLFLGVRFMMLSPIAAAEPLGPVAILKRSWALTRGHALKLLGLVLVVVLVFLILAFAISVVGGIAIHTLVGKPDPGSLSFFLALLLNTLLNMVFTAIFATLIARIYAQLAECQTSGT
jgi:hypothetical protein